MEALTTSLLKFPSSANAGCLLGSVPCENRCWLVRKKRQEVTICSSAHLSFLRLILGEFCKMSLTTFISSLNPTKLRVLFLFFTHQVHFFAASIFIDLWTSTRGWSTYQADTLSKKTDSVASSSLSKGGGTSCPPPLSKVGFGLTWGFIGACTWLPWVHVHSFQIVWSTVFTCIHSPPQALIVFSPSVLHWPMSDERREFSINAPFRNEHSAILSFPVPWLFVDFCVNDYLLK